MRHQFYDDPEYKKKQASITREYWQSGIFNSTIKPLETRICKNSDCRTSFQIKPYEPKMFCSLSCSATINNKNRIVSSTTRLRHSAYMKSRPDLYRKEKSFYRKSYKIIICQNTNCHNPISLPPYLAKTRRFCSVSCAMKIIGGKTTSAKASRGKSGIRVDIDESICFYSTWETNIARVFNLIGIKWKYAPTIFDLGEHTYRPDFYLPSDRVYIEVKNFMNEYSLNRDKLFREKYPNIRLDVISKIEYKEIETIYKPLIGSWEN